MIPYFDPSAIWEPYREEIEEAIRRVLSSGILILGAEVEAFEAEFAAYVGTRYAVGVGTGTDAVILALRSLGIGEGAEVITVGNAGVPPIAAIRAAGCDAEFGGCGSKNSFDGHSATQGGSNVQDACDIARASLWAAGGSQRRDELCRGERSRGHRGLRPSAWCELWRSARGGLWGGGMFLLLSNQKPGSFWRWRTLRDE